MRFFEFNTPPVLDKFVMLLRNQIGRARSKHSGNQLSWDAISQLARSNGFDFAADYETFKHIYDTNPAVQELTKNFNARGITLNVPGAEDEPEQDGDQEPAQSKIDKIAASAAPKQMAKARESVESDKTALPELAVRKPDAGKSLGVPRGNMPQLHRDHYQELFDYMQEAGVTWRETTVDPRDLKPIQKEFNDAGVVKALTLRKLEKPILISRDNYVVDGNHRWIAAMNTRQDKISAIQFDADAVQVMMLFKKFSKTTFKGLY